MDRDARPRLCPDSMRNFGPCRDSKFRLEPDELSLSGYGFRNPRDYPDAIGIIICYTAVSSDDEGFIRIADSKLRRPDG